LKAHKLKTIEKTSNSCEITDLLHSDMFYQDIGRWFRNQSIDFHLLLIEDSKPIDLSYVDFDGIFYEDILKWFKKRLERKFLDDFFAMEENESKCKMKLDTIEEENEEDLNTSY
jgi:hypothetical protein